MSTYLLSVDIGTQGTKAALFEAEEMKLICTGFEESRLIQPKPGTVWQEAEDILNSVIHTIRDVVDRSGVPAADIAAVGIDSQMAGIMGVDANGDAVTYYDSWLDMRCGKYMDRMRSTAGKEIISITGGPVTYTHGPKILWWKGEERETFERIDKFVLPHGYVVGKLTGLTGDAIYFDYTCLQYSGFGDNRNLKWSDTLLELFAVPKEKMARICSPFEIVGRLTKEFAQQTHLLEGTPFAAGAGDTSASIFGAGMFEKDQLLDCAGTASVLCSIVDDFVPDVRYETMTMMRSPVDGLWMPLAYINGGGQCLRWFRDELTGDPKSSYEELAEKAKGLPPGSEGLLFIPHFAGRVLPNNPYLKGAFLGVDWKHTREHMFRAVMEGISYEYHFYLDVMKKLYPENRFRDLTVMGGGSRSELFNSIKADVLDVEVSAFDMEDTALIGSAVIAGVGAGVFQDYREPLSRNKATGEKISPDPKNHAVYEEYAAAYLDAMEALTPVYKQKVFNLN